MGHGRLKAVEIFAGGGGVLLGTALAGFVHEMANLTDRKSVV